MADKRKKEISIPNEWSPMVHQWPIINAITNGVKRMVAVWHRRAGKDSTSLNITAVETFKRKGVYWHMLPTALQARKVVWDSIDKHGRRVIDQVFPVEIRKAVNNQEMKMELLNGSIWQCVGSDNYDSLVGSNPVGVVFSEYSIANPKAWDFIRPILAENGGWAIFIYTARGRNAGYNLFKMACDNDKWFCEKLTVDDTDVLSPEVIEEERLAGMSEAMIQQEFYCHPPSTLITTSNGQVEIQHLSVGDIVLTHSGRWRKVNKIGWREYEGELVEIERYGEKTRPLLATPNHPVRTLNPGKQTYKWSEAGDIWKSDILVMPRLKLGKPLISIHLVTLLAWFICEGSVAKTAAQWTLNINEDKESKQITDSLDSLEIKWIIILNKENNSRNIIAKDSKLADFLVINCGSTAPHKRIPFSLIGGFESYVFDILILGDGCHANDRQYEFMAYTTVSHNLARDVQLLSSTLGYKSGISLSKGGEGIIKGRKVNCKDKYSVQIRENKRVRTRKIVPAKHGVGVVVTDVRRKPYSGKIYNLSVSHDESYVAEGVCVHNCAFDVPIEGAYFGPMLNICHQTGRVGRVPVDPILPVHTAWDLGIGDAMAIWLVQAVGKEIRLVGYYEHSGEGLSHYINYLMEWAKQHNIRYGEHFAPHDIAVRELSTGKSRLDTAREMGIRFTVVKRHAIDDGIEAVRRLFPRFWIDEAGCSQGLIALSDYTKTWDDKKMVFQDKPLHNYASHGADAIRTFAMGWKESLSGNGRKSFNTPTTIAADFNVF